MRALAVLVVTLAACFWLVWSDPSTTYEREARAAAEASRITLEARLEAERAEALAPWITAAWVAVYVLAIAGAGATAAYLGSLAYLDVRRRTAIARQAEVTVLPLPDGRLPVPLAQLPSASVAALGAVHARHQLAVTEQRMDRALTFEARTDPALAELLAAPAADK